MEHEDRLYPTPDAFPDVEVVIRRDALDDMAILAREAGFPLIVHAAGGMGKTVMIETVEPASPTTHYPRCVAGARACPPEDCGGPAGYAQLLRTLAGRMTDDKRELLAWLGEPFDPEVFRVAEANARLTSI
ncbi:plasmid pRiA4b ORF-3 family protein [Burkholderia contaminans]|nr:plasmid pRiA4b ORF-3 family protein [Burkholderia contaminans]